jgi:hypothetical protein
MFGIESIVPQFLNEKETRRVEAINAARAFFPGLVFPGYGIETLEPIDLKTDNLLVMNDVKRTLDQVFSLSILRCQMVPRMVLN